MLEIVFARRNLAEVGADRLSLNRDLHLLLLDHILGLPADQQVAGNAIRYSQDENAVLDQLEKEDYQAAFILNPPKPEEILMIVENGETMPQKSTYFYPKVVSGLVINKIDADEEIAES